MPHTEPVLGWPEPVEKCKFYNVPSGRTRLAVRRSVARCVADTPFILKRHQFIKISVAVCVCAQTHRRTHALFFFVLCCAANGSPGGWLRGSARGVEGGWLGVEQCVR